MSGGRSTGGGGGGAGAIPLLMLIVMIDPGKVWPLGEVPTTVPYEDELFTDVGWSATWKPASLRR